jgi:CMP/dCMP kinase
MIISISGAEGAGKSTIAKLLAAKLGWPRYYIGGLRREKAKERGLTLEEYNKLGETDPLTDIEVDEYQKKLGKTQDDFIIEGRTSWHFIPQSYKIFLDVTFAEGAKRIFKALREDNSRNEGKNLKTYEDVLASLKSRRGSDKIRYAKYFGIDVFDLKNYDFILDTTNLNIDQVFAKVLKKITEKQKNTRHKSIIKFNIS